ncbi:UDP-N-acetylmuramate dehydrogenase [Alteromonas sediminis]|uniref:UDP-N-acetylenolpyruvoylglucosamine reductase n=1 Tax=Alteromonas sediminis TaxID=2259342 RepID=A0A3N5ZD49_9ALTE|nr:UDP-N-acetylmuramate dehydrogenase [Alteromonas sediminis]RPJ67858.1 UDP-N-acetylmuramate dehydrogenase [Alteromonas sediminis]
MVSLSSYHTFGLSARCRALYLLEREEQVAQYIAQEGPKYLIGEGSNTIFLEDFDGTVAINQLKGVEYKEKKHHHEISVKAGENWHNFVTSCMHNGWHGLENLALIPGSVGAAPIQNIGAYGVEAETFINRVLAVNTVTGDYCEFTHSECEFAYRDSVFKRAPEWLVTQVVFHLPKDASLNVSYKDIAQLNPKTPQALYEHVVNIRRTKLPDPNVVGNAGSFFKNPVIDKEHWLTLKSNFPTMVGFPVEGNRVKVAAAWLIDSLGFKQKSAGGIRCHPNQPLVLINANQGTGAELISFSQSIMTEVFNVYNIQLEPEARLIGKQGLICL